MDSEESDRGKLNWKLALIISAVIHVVCLGIILLSSDVPEAEADVATEENDAPKSNDGGRVGDSGASRTADTSDSSDGVGGVSSRTSTRSASSGATRVSSRRTSSRSGSNGDSVGASSGGQSAEQIVYVVQRGDNLTKIARKYKCTETEIIKLNKIKNPNRIFVGLKLKVPAPVN